MILLSINHFKNRGAAIKLTINYLISIFKSANNFYCPRIFIKKINTDKNLYLSNNKALIKILAVFMMYKNSFYI
jgi:hypothetical protein